MAWGVRKYDRQCGLGEGPGFVKQKCCFCEESFSVPYYYRSDSPVCWKVKCRKEKQKQKDREQYIKRRAENPEALREKGRRSYAKRAAALMIVEQMQKGIMP